MKLRIIAGTIAVWTMCGASSAFAQSSKAAWRFEELIDFAAKAGTQATSGSVTDTGWVDILTTHIKTPNAKGDRDRRRAPVRPGHRHTPGVHAVTVRARAQAGISLGCLSATPGVTCTPAGSAGAAAFTGAGVLSVEVIRLIKDADGTRPISRTFADNQGGMASAVQPFFHTAVSTSSGLPPGWRPVRPTFHTAFQRHASAGRHLSTVLRIQQADTRDCKRSRRREARNVVPARAPDDESRHQRHALSTRGDDHSDRRELRALLAAGHRGVPSAVRQG